MSERGSLLVLNAGSSSVKFCTFDLGPDGPARDLAGQVALVGDVVRFVVWRGAETLADRGLGTARLDHGVALGAVVEFLDDRHSLDRCIGVGHRVVHGGPEYAAPTRIDDGVLARLDAYVPLAPLHQPHNLAAIRAVAARFPLLPQVACFDTAFHRTVPEIAQLYALPLAYAAEGVRRYGFHGLSYEHVAARLPALDPRAAAGRTIALHLGNGASMCAMAAGRSVSTTMGFTAVDGLPMGTRSGALDPGVLLYLMDRHGYAARDLERLLYHRSGLLGVSGISADVRVLLASDAPEAKLALDLFVYRAGREIGSLAAALGGLDALVFTAGIGEHQPLLRARICEAAGWLGLRLDDAANRAHGPRISRPDSAVSAWVVPADEESVIARHVLAVLGR
ncbi:MAG: acetate/propionate family kinase [Steroidobacteraceae bacterium]